MLIFNPGTGILNNNFMKSPKPYSLGRMVLYVPSEDDQKQMGVANKTSTPLPAIIVNDWLEVASYQESGTVNLNVLLDGVGSIWATSVHYSDGKESGTWHWPEIK